MKSTSPAYKAHCLSIVMVFTLGFLFSLDSNAAGKKKRGLERVIQFKAAHGPYQIISKPLKLFKEEVERLTEGRVKVRLIIPKNQKESNLASVQKVFNDVTVGNIEMSQLYSAYMSIYNPDFNALEIPFILKDHAHAFEVVDGEIGKGLLASLDTNSPLKGLGFTYCGGYRIVGSNNTKITKIEDFKGLDIYAESPMSITALKALGANIIDDVTKENQTTAVNSKKQSAYVTVYPRYFHGNEYKKAKIANVLDFNTQFTVLVINKKFFETLSKKDQEIVAFAAQKASAKERQLAIDVADNVLKNAEKYGIEVVKMSPEEKQRMAEAFEKVDWTKKHFISSEIIEKIKNLSKEKLGYN